MCANRLFLNSINDIRSDTKNTSTPEPSSRRDAPVPQGRKKDNICILILGPSGSGKSSLINLASDEKFPVASPGVGLCTNGFRTSKPIIIEDQAIRLIDSPGFNTPSYTNPKIFKQLVSHLWQLRGRENQNGKLTGIVYLHPEGSDLHSSQLQQNLETIKVLFGGAWLPHIILAIVGDDLSSGPNATRLLQDPKSPFNGLQAVGIKVRTLTFHSTSIHELLMEFDSNATQEPLLYSKTKDDDGNLDREKLGKLVDEALGIQRTKPSNRARVGRRPPHRVSLEESEISRQQLQLALKAAEEELKLLRGQLEQIRLEYGSLRSELQLHDNTEQNRVVQSLKDLNRSIEDFSRVAAQHIVDSHIEASIVNDTTALHALNLSELRIQFEHQDGVSSLVASSNGAGMPIEDFFDLALRTIICRRLHEGVFQPFHPTITAGPEATFMSYLYEGVRRHAPQNVAAKWRASSFVALSREEQPEARSGVIEAQIEHILKGDISKLIDNFFGQEKDDALLSEQQQQRLRKIVVSAWEWNDVLKGDVVTLGDFQTTFYGPGVPFDTQSMLELEPDKSRRSLPETVICTTGLGLSLSHSKANRDVPGPVVVYQATVATECFYTRS